MANETRVGVADPRIQQSYTNGVSGEGVLVDVGGAEKTTAITADPIVNILAAFYSIPTDYHADLFRDFRDAAQSGDLRRLLDTISDWTATAELYAQPELAGDLQEAIGRRKGVADWLRG